MNERKKLGRGLDEISHLFLSSEDESIPKVEVKNRFISVVSGTWGIEHPFLLGNLALKLAADGHRVTIVSFTSFFPTINFLLNVPSGRSTLQLAEEGRGFDSAVVKGPMGLHVVSGGGDITNLVHLRPDCRENVLAWLKELEERNDFLFLDVTPSFTTIPLPADWLTREVMVLTAVDVADLVNAYRVIKAVLSRNRAARLGLIACRVRTMVEAKATYEKMSAVVEKYLGSSVESWGFILDDLNIPRSIWRRSPVALFPSGSRAEECLTDIARRILGTGASKAPEVGSIKTEFQRTTQRFEQASDWDGPRLE